MRTKLRSVRRWRTDVAPWEYRRQQRPTLCGHLSVATVSARPPGLRPRGSLRSRGEHELGQALEVGEGSDPEPELAGGLRRRRGSRRDGPGHRRPQLSGGLGVPPPGVPALWLDQVEAHQRPRQTPARMPSWEPPWYSYETCFPDR